MFVCARVLEALGSPRLTIDGHLEPLGYIAPGRAHNPLLPHGDADGVWLGPAGVVGVLVRDRLVGLRALSTVPALILDSLMFPPPGMKSATTMEFVHVVLVLVGSYLGENSLPRLMALLAVSCLCRQRVREKVGKGGRKTCISLS